MTVAWKWLGLALGVSLLGGCAHGAPDPDGGPVGGTCRSDSDCDDGLACNGMEVCSASGRCEQIPHAGCDDGIPCTDDACSEPSGMCNHVPNDRACGPTEVCLPDRGCGPPPPCRINADCDDRVVCNGTEVCDPGFGCRSGGPPSCDDGIDCTVDSCDPAAGAAGACVNLRRDALCADGMTCNGDEVCDPDASGADAAGCVAGRAVDCDDRIACTADVCMEPDGMCMHMGPDADGDGHATMDCFGGDDCDDTDPDVHPGAPEACDGVDNDCNGSVDDGAGMCMPGSSVMCMSSCGSAGMADCTASCTPGPCRAPEFCNGCDDDGDGMIDEDFECPMGGSGSCTTSCMTAGTHTCSTSCYWTPCVAAMETCGNGCDDDGDGMIDEGCGPMVPPNDQCSGAIALSGSGMRSDTLADATAQATGCGDGVDVFYSVMVTQKSMIYLDTLSGTSLNTRISYRGTSCPGTSVACNDDACGGSQSQLAVQVGSGTHTFAVHTASASVTGAAFTLRYVIVPAAAGDNTAITASGTFSGSTSGSGQVSASCGGSAGSPEDAYYWTQCPGQTRTVAATTCRSPTNYDTVLHVKRNGTQVICNDDDSSCSYSSLRSTISTTASDWGIFQLFVDGYSSSSSGTFELGVTSF